MSLESEVQKLAEASSEQTAVSQDLAQEVAGKMGEIDKKVADSQKKFDDFISGDFDRNVNEATDITICIDPVDGDDANDGSTTAKSIATSDRLSQLTSIGYARVVLLFRRGTTFDLQHQIRAKLSISVNDWTGSDGSPDLPTIKQSVPAYAGLIAPDVNISDAEILTYKAVENETLPEIYKTSFFSSTLRLKCQASKIVINDTQLFHIHDGGSGDNYHRRSFSCYGTGIYILESAPGVIGSRQQFYTRYASAITPAIDLFATSFSINLNGQKDSLRSALGVPDTYVVTNLNLDMT